MISNVNGHGVTNAAGPTHTRVVKAPVNFSREPQLKVGPAAASKLSAPTAWQPNPSGKLSVKKAPVRGGKNYNPQRGTPPLRASYTSR